MSKQTGVEMIAAERVRQVEAEGYSADHDADHLNGQLARAAACYVMPSTLRESNDLPPRPWPWHHRYWKPRPDDRVRELVKAGALIAAEIDRLLAIEKSS